MASKKQTEDLLGRFNKDQNILLTAKEVLLLTKEIRPEENELVFKRSDDPTNKGWMVVEGKVVQVEFYFDTIWTSSSSSPNSVSATASRRPFPGGVPEVSNKMDWKVIDEPLTDMSISDFKFRCDLSGGSESFDFFLEIRSFFKNKKSLL